MPLTNEQIPSTSKAKGGRILSHGRHSSADIDLTLPKFPRIEDCVHFHYETVGYGCIKISFVEESADGLKINGSLSLEDFNPAFNIRISCKENTWVVRRNVAHFETLDKWLHECSFDRRFSHLPCLRSDDLKTKNLDDIQSILRSYLMILSGIVDGTERQIYCAPVLHWLEMDNHGRNLVPHALGDVADINIPAIAAARVIRRYQACDDDELTLNVGDMVSIIEMGASGWWRGKQGLKVGSFPCQCVRRINSATDIVGTHQRSFSPPNIGPPRQDTPIVRKHGKFMEFLRSFLDTRPSKAHLKKKGILRERVFGCDLGELLHRTDEEIPTVVTDCMRFVEKYGVVDGIYRVSGVASHIRHLKYEFDSDGRPDLENAIMDLPKLGNVPGMARENNFKCDAHSVAGLCKLYFRELPNPLLTYQLYNRFASAVTDYDVEDRLLKVHDVIQQLPPPHYRTLKHLINHLRFMAEQEGKTSMHSRNLAIVWAPNLLRSREIEAGLAAFTEARVQSVVTEFLIVNGDLLFSEKLQTMQYDQEHKPPRPRSLMILPTPKLISLEEAQARSKSGVVTPVSQQTTPIDSAIGSVRLRNASSKGSSSEKRKRHKKSTSASNAYPSSSPHPVKTSKQGHRQTASYSEFLSSTPISGEVSSPPKTNSGFNWKEKLGVLLRKSTAQPRKSSRQASLRRSQSCDSLVLSHGFQTKTTNDNEESDFFNSKQQISRAKSCEETGLSDRSFPEPQVPHTLKHARGKQSDLGPLKCSDFLYSPVQSSICTSLFSSLDTDPPRVMGEEGLGFDPLNYGLKNTSAIRRNAATDPDKYSKDASPRSGDDLSLESPKIRFSTKKGSKILSAKLISTPNSRSNSPESEVMMTLHDVKTKRSLNEPGERNVTLVCDHNANPSLRLIPAEQRSSADCKTNQSSKNNRRSRDRSSQSHGLDILTADSITATVVNSRAKATRNSAAERLCVGKKDAAIFRPKPDWIPTSGTDLLAGTDAFDDFGSVTKPRIPVSQISNPSRQVSVQFYNIPNKNQLKKNDHYGSFIALVGSNSQNARGGSRKDAPSFEKYDKKQSESQVTDLHSSDTGSLDKPEFRSSVGSENKFSTAVDSFLYPGGANSTSYHIPKQPRFASRLHPRKLETFSPDGKRRENYPNTPPISRINPSKQSSVSSDHHALPQQPSHPNDQSCRDFRSFGFSPPSPRHQPPLFLNKNHLGWSQTSANRFHSSDRNRSFSTGNEFDVPSANFLRRPDRVLNPRFSALAFENKTYEDSARLLGRSATSRAHSNDVTGRTSSRLSASSNSSKYREATRHFVPAPIIPFPRNYAPRKPPPAYDNPSYELRPIYYNGRGRYAFPDNHQRPSLIASVRHNTAALSWV